MPCDLRSIADASIGCAFRGDPEGYAVLVRDLTPAELRRLGIRLATRAADAMTCRAQDAGFSARETAAMWQRWLLHRQRKAAEAAGE